jgi:hypothetical protein
MVIIAIVAVGAIAFIGGVFREKPSLLVNSQTLSGITGDTATLTFEISNLGGDATGVVITAFSAAFTQTQTASFDVLADKTVTVSCQVSVNDVESTNYPITLTYTAEGNIFGGVSGGVAGNALFHAVPSLEIVNVHWLNDVSWIGQNNYTMLYFNIKSNTNFAAEDVTVKLTLLPSVANMVVNPSDTEVSIISPKATSEQIAIAVASMGASIGNHPLQIKLSSDDYEITTAAISIEVR